MLGSGLIVLTGLLTTASTAPGYKVPDPAPPAIEQGAVSIRITMPLCAVGTVPIDFCQVLIMWLETGGRISFSIDRNGVIAQWDRTYAIGPMDLPTGK